MESSFPSRSSAMLRKVILMPPSLIEKVKRIALAKNVSFAEVVRTAVDDFDETLTAEDEALLEAMLDKVIASTHKSIAVIDKMIERIDKTHAKLECQWE